MRALRIILTATVLLVLPSCGGGGGGSPAPGVPTNVVDGAYHLVSYSARGTTGAVFTGAWGTAQTTGTGGIDIQGTANGSASASNTPVPLGTYDLGVTAGGEVTWTLAGTVTHRGGVSDDGSVVVLGTVANTLDPTLVILIRTSSTNGPTNLAGPYELGSLGGLGSSYGAFTADGVGGATGTVASNAYGTVTGAAPLSFTTTVGMYGNSDFASIATLYRGAVTPDGQLAAWAGDDAPIPGPPGLVAMVRKGAGAPPLGTYHSVAIEYAATFVMASTSGVVTFDASGTMSATASVNINGAVSSVTGTATFAHNPSNGEMAITRSGTSEVLRGCVSPNGRYAIAAGGVNTGSTPILWIMCRQ